MEDSKKKPIMVVVVLVCLGLAGAVTYMSRTESGGAESLERGEMMWVKCNNPDCGAEYQIDTKDYLMYIQEHMKGMSTPPLVCKECGKKSVYKAVKCGKCGLIFFSGTVSEDIADRCPECGFSKTEDDRKKVLEEKGK